MVSKEVEIFNLFALIMEKFMHQGEDSPKSTRRINRGVLIIDYIGNEKKCNMKDITKNLNLPPSTATRQVDKLVKLNLVKREIPNDNRRSVILTLTDSGNEAYLNYQEHRSLFVTKILQDFTDEERMTLVKMLQKIIDNTKYFTH